MNSSPLQLTLGIGLDDDAKIENFFVAESNRVLIEEFEKPNPSLYLWGASHSGKTHLLQALCHQESEADKSVIYIPLKEHEKLTPEMLDGLSDLDLICLDDLHLVSGKPEWENGLFVFFNAVKESGARLVISADRSPHELNTDLKDWHSRLQSIPVYRLSNLSDEERVTALQFRAQQRGIELNDAVAEFIYQRSNRSFGQLITVLDTLDQVSLAEKRKLTIPLVKTTMGW
jgi:DnaA-homolog protein